ncbi:HAD family hydrolase [soil metagenome]
MNAIIIDFDGTIADSFEQVLEFLASQTGRSYASITPEERAELKGLSMMNLALRMGVSYWRLPLTYFRGKARLTKHMHTIPVFAGMDTVLAALHAENYKLFIISSNSRRNITRFLTQHGMSGYFSNIYSNAGWFGKGSILKKAVRQNKLEASKTVYIGDEVRDIIGARLAGMPSVAVTWGFSSEAQLLQQSPTIVVRKPSELQKALVDWGRTV